MASSFQRAMLKPVRLVPAAFLAVILFGTALLLLPVSHPGDVQVLPAIFTAVSATTITGLTTVDTATYWTPFGKAVIILLTQMGGYGIMSSATLLALIVRGRIQLSDTLVAQTETQTQTLGEVRRLLVRIGVLMASIEVAVGVVLGIRFWLAYGMGPFAALGHGLFYSCMSFTNAGFALHSDSIMGFVADPWVIVPMCLTVVIGSLGYPVLFELWLKRRRPDHWTVHTRITFYGWMLLLGVGIATFLWFEWTNPATLGPMAVTEKINASLAGGVMPRSGGFNIVDYAVIREETVLVTIILMFIGGGSAGTSGGIKVTTFILLSFVILSEIRGETDVTIAHRRISEATQRQALVVALISVGLVALGSMVIVSVTDLPLTPVVFESVSAFGTVGLSLGLTPRLDTSAQVVIMVLMFVGRVGTITVASALALRSHRRHYHLPEERPIVG
ncbi:TrkH family potassium uptake protein [Agilicoccus flavus]|uniref:TrkH family potassium uptake protein n=1 Tax=Agilicoccus flavus TaxID=2775968 RepID=UPI001CF6061F|nr:potassium transporter TrkG [Agilicoccus flavus]